MAFGLRYACMSPDKNNEYLMQDIAMTVRLAVTFLINIFELKHKGEKFLPR